MPIEAGGPKVISTTETKLLPPAHSPWSTFIKYGSLITLTTVHSASSLMIRHSQIRGGDKFLSSTAVVMTEVAKLILSLLFVLREDGNLYGLYHAVVKQPCEALKMCVPSLLYVVCNNLLYVGAQHLDATTFLVTNKLKILATAFFAVIMLKKVFRLLQWLSLTVLIGGIVLVQMAQSTETSVADAQQNRLLGFGALAVTSSLSGFSCIFLEMILKGSDTSVWMRNVQLSLLSLPLALATCLGYNWTQIKTQGFFFGYDWFVWCLVATHACGGLTVAVVIRYADNMLKCFASAMSIVIASVASVFLFGLQVSWLFTAGVATAIASVFLYNYHDLKCRRVPVPLAEAK